MHVLPVKVARNAANLCSVKQYVCSLLLLCLLLCSVCQLQDVCVRAVLCCMAFGFSFFGQFKAGQVVAMLILLPHIYVYSELFEFKVDVLCIFI